MNIRRSTRPSKPMNVDVPDMLSGDENETFVEPSEDEQDEERVERKTKGKKRKSGNRSAAGQPPAKKPRGKRGILSELLEMPYDIVFEIFSQLNPNDLLNLMRTNKDLRSFFRSRESASLWKAARHNFEGLPECPEDLSEPQYADLAFGKLCQVCFRKIHILHTCWSARIKICNKCLPTRFSSYLRDVPSDLREYVPSLLVDKPGGRSRYYRRQSIYYCVPTMDRFNAFNRDHTPESKKILVDDAVNSQKVIFEHSRACVAWADKYKSELAKDKESLVDNRIDNILERLRDVGWDDEIDRMDERSLAQLKKQPELLKACQKDLTEKVAVNLVVHLEQYMIQAQQKRITQERKDFLHARLPIFRQSIEDYRLSIPVGVAREFPHLCDLFFHPLVRNFIDNTPNEEFEKTRLEPLLPKLPKVVHEVQMSIREKAIALVAEGCGEGNTFDPDTVLDLATTIFSCAQCYVKGPNYRSDLYVSESLRFPEVMYHACANVGASLLRKYTTESDVDLAYFGNWISRSVWNKYSQISFKVENQKIMSEAIALCGFDPKVATITQMDAVDPILECVACNDAHKGRAMMRWSIVAAHYRERHVKKDSYSQVEKMELELVDEEDAKAARKRMDEEIARERASNIQDNSSSNSMTCAHCLYKTVDSSNSVTVKEHVRSVHSILRPTDDDIVPIPSKRFIHSVFYMWPPRDA